LIHHGGFHLNLQNQHPKLFKQALQLYGLSLLHFHGCGDVHAESLQVMGEAASIPTQLSGLLLTWINR
jgi:hypothetical protein